MLYIYLYKRNLLELIIGCSPTDLTMVGCEWKVQEYSSFSVLFYNGRCPAGLLYIIES